MMEPWSYNLEGKGLMFSDEIDLQVDAFATSKKPSEWGDKSTFNFERNGLVSNGEAVESMEDMKLGVHDFVRKPFHGNQGMEILSGEVCCSTSKRAVSPQYMFASNSCFEEVASEAKLSSSALEANSLNSSLIDLKLGRLADWKDVENSMLLNYRPVLPSAPPSLLTKRARKTCSYSQTAFCQVSGCNKDLSSSKDYHKRHKVCDVHSKTPKVIVNGIEQRFCQQCSRFHLLPEFDDGKRSCRKRLAGHNERRRKPQLVNLPGKHTLLQSHQGTGYVGTSLPKRTTTPFVLPDIFRGGFVYPGKSVQANGFRHIKVEGESFNRPQSATPVTTWQVHSNSIVHLHGVGKQHCLGLLPSSGTDDCNVNVSTVQKLSGPSISSRALSLLSAQSPQDLSSHLTGIPMASPQIFQGDSAHHMSF